MLCTLHGNFNCPLCAVDANFYKVRHDGNYNDYHGQLTEPNESLPDNVIEVDFILKKRLT